MAYTEEFTEELLKKYIEDGEFMVYLHPQYSVSENRIVGAEALVRRIHEGTTISPGAFIPALEKKGLITKLDRYLWECVFFLQSERKKSGHTLIPISVNVSREDLCNIDVFETMKSLSEKYDVEPKYIHVEITESAFVNDNARINESINGLKSHGFTILIDDFGSGYSALNILKDIEADVIKLDMEFFDLTEKNKVKGKNIIDSVIEMAHRLKLGLIAEGVENTYQLDILKEAGCDVIQGYFFYRPMSVNDFNTLIDGMRNDFLEQTEEESAFGRECYAESRTLASTGKYNNALTLAKRAATQISPESDAALYCDLQNLTGAIYSAMGNELMALDMYLSGLSVAVRNNFHLVTGRYYNNIGAEYTRLGDTEHAIKYFELSLKEYEEEKKSGNTNIEIMLFKTNLNLCVEYIESKNYDEAEKHLEQAYAYIENPRAKELDFYYYTVQSVLFIKTGREEAVRKNFDALVKMTLGAENCFNNWDSVERLGMLALELKDFDTLKKIIEAMDREFGNLPDEMIELDILVRIKEFRMDYYEATGDEEALRREEKEYIKLCRKLCLQTKADRATTIDYKILLKTEAEAQEEKRKTLDIDSLTGVGNRYKLEKDYKLLQKNSDENSEKICLGIIDADYLKDVNDTYGHLQGDYYLKVISKIIKEAVASAGGIYRYTGDAFVVLLVDVNEDTVLEIAKKIRGGMSEMNLLNPATDKKIQTVSQSYVMTDRIKNTEIGQLFSVSEKELTAVKENGGDGVRVTE